MNAFRGLLIALFGLMLVYTVLTVADHGWTLFEVYFGNIMEVSWQGQFNLDFGSYLLLSGLWIAWREHFSARGILIGLFAPILGLLLFAPYLFWASVQAKGDMKALLMGKR